MIAIIGMLAAVVLASLGAARSRAQDAAVRSNLNQVRTLGQEFFSIRGSYSSDAGGVYSSICLTNQAFFRMTSGDAELRAIADKVAVAIDAAYQAGNSSFRECRIDGNRSEYLVVIGYAQGGYRCIDSRGVARDMSTSPAGGVLTCS